MLKIAKSWDSLQIKQNYYCSTVLLVAFTILASLPPWNEQNNIARLESEGKVEKITWTNVKPRNAELWTHSKKQELDHTPSCTYSALDHMTRSLLLFHTPNVHCTHSIIQRPLCKPVKLAPLQITINLTPTGQIHKN